MAEITISTKVEQPDLTPLVKSFGDLKNQLKAAKDELAGMTVGSDEFVKQSAKVGALKDKLNELNDSIKNTSGAPVENLTSSFGLLSNQVRNLDFEGASVSLKQFGSGLNQIKPKDLVDGFKSFGSTLGTVGKALLTNPIFLIAAAITGIVTAVVLLKDKVKFLSDAFEFVGNIIGETTQALKDFSDWIGISSFKSTEAAEAQLEAAKKTQSAVTERYDTEIKFAQAAGRNTIEIEKKKGEAVRESIKEQIKQIALLAQINGEYSDEQLKQIEDLKKAYKDSLVEQKVAEIKNEKDKTEINKQAAENRKKEKEERIKQSKEEADELFRILSEAQDREREQIEFRKAEKKSQQEQEIKEAEYAANAKLEWEKWAAAENEKIQQEVEANAQLRAERKAQIEQNYFSAAQAISEAFFQFQLNAAEGNEAKQLEIKKKAFQVDKAFRVAQATMDAAGAIQKTLAAGGPLAIPLSISMGVLASANIAKILATKFEGGSVSASSGGGSLSAGSGPRTPTTQATQLPMQQQQSTQYDAQGNKIGEQPIVVRVSEINDTQRRVARVVEQVKF